MSAPTRNYRIVGLSDANTVIRQVDGQAPADSGEKPSAWGTWGLSRGEVAILRRGLTASGRDRERPR